VLRDQAPAIGIGFGRARSPSKNASSNSPQRVQLRIEVQGNPLFNSRSSSHF
jgi:hypothetical protein